MALKLILDANKIYHKEFQGTKPGYDALQVDTFLDFVIRDYQSMDDYVKKTEQKEKELNDKIDFLNSKLRNVEAENETLKAKFGNIQPDNVPSLNNLELVKRISKYEEALKKAGIDPKTIS